MMKALELINKTREYLDYLEEHILNVGKAWNELQDKCKDMEFIYNDYLFGGIDEEVRRHDISKLSKYEFMEYRLCFFPTKSESKTKLSEAWEHHKEYNTHHWENWTTNEYSDPNEWIIHCAHMIVDWMAMGYKFNDTAQVYYEKNKDKIILPNYAVNFIYEIFSRTIDTQKGNEDDE